MKRFGDVPKENKKQKQKETNLVVFLGLFHPSMMPPHNRQTAFLFIVIYFFIYLFKGNT